MKYALLIYGADLVPETSDAEARKGWIEYARAAKEAGILLGAECRSETHVRCGPVDMLNVLESLPS